MTALWFNLLYNMITGCASMYYHCCATSMVLPSETHEVARRALCKTIPSLCSSSVSLAPLPWDVASLEAWQRWGERRGRAVGANPPQTLTMMRAFSYCPVELYYIIPCWWCPWEKAVRGRHHRLQEGFGAAWCYDNAGHQYQNGRH